MGDDGTLTYTFIESIKATFPYYVVRLLGGLMFLSGMLIMAYNVIKTLTSSELEITESKVEAA
jgi:cbb3-type cytochrome oxidase subunit 1